jgi:hypothetical protein
MKESPANSARQDAIRIIDRPVYVLGDNHGFYGEIYDLVAERNLRGSVIIHVGDGDEGGEDWTDDGVRYANTRFQEFDVEYLSIRGNHSNPALFDGSVNHSHFKLIPDYTQLLINGQSWLLIGGAISINRIDLVPGVDWWSDERFVLRKDLIAAADVLVTHSGPSWIGPPCKNPFVQIFADSEMERGIDLIDELEIERRLHDHLFNIVRPKHWYLGHFHHSETKTHKGCKGRILGVCELYQHHP